MFYSQQEVEVYNTRVKTHCTT